MKKKMNVVWCAYPYLASLMTSIIRIYITDIISYLIRIFSNIDSVRLNSITSYNAHCYIMQIDNCNYKKYSDKIISYISNSVELFNILHYFSTRDMKFRLVFLFQKKNLFFICNIII